MSRLRALGIVGVLGLLWNISAGTFAQNVARPAFEAASVKVNTSGDVRADGVLAGARFSMINETLARLIGEAYAAPQALARNRIVGGPEWIDVDRFDVQGVAQEVLTRERARLMLQAVLADRFQLTAHTDVRQLPVFNLVLARNDGRLGSELRRSDTDCDALRSGAVQPTVARDGIQSCIMGFGFGRLSGTGMTITDLATLGLSRATGRPTIDRTGLTGAFDWTLVWTPDNLPPRAPGTAPSQPLLVNGLTVDPDGPPLPTAIQEQLGLKLQPSTGPVDVVVIDRVARPAPN